jgi:hypothetical protein
MARVARRGLHRARSASHISKLRKTSTSIRPPMEEVLGDERHLQTVPQSLLASPLDSKRH